MCVCVYHGEAILSIVMQGIIRVGNDKFCRGICDCL